VEDFEKPATVLEAGKFALLLLHEECAFVDFLLEGLGLGFKPTGGFELIYCGEVVPIKDS